MKGLTEFLFFLGVNLCQKRFFPGSLLQNRGMDRRAIIVSPQFQLDPFSADAAPVLQKKAKEYQGVAPGRRRQSRPV